MVTYLYWMVIFTIAFGLFYFIGYKIEELKIAAIACISILLIGFVAYYFHFQQIFVKQYGGKMTVSIPAGELHLAATWKGDHLWIENYNPKTNTCHFREYSRGNLLQGEVIIKNCNPLLRQPTASEAIQP